MALKTFRKWMVVFNVFSISVTPSAHGAEYVVRLKNSRNYREYSPQYEQMERAGQLAAGSELRIPEQFIVNNKKTGQPDFELTLNNWLRHDLDHKRGKAAHAHLSKLDGDRYDYFFPVEVVQAGQGSTFTRASTAKDQQGKTVYYVALKSLLRDGQRITIRDDAQAFKSPVEAPPPAVAAERSSTASSEAQITCPGGCIGGEGVLSQLIENLNPALEKVNKRTLANAVRTKTDSDMLDKTLQNSCGFSLVDLQDEVRAQTQESEFTFEMMMNLMVQESSGRCLTLNSEHDKSQSVGLWQINTDTAKRYKVKRCTAKQTQQLKGLSLAEMREGPRCIENPVVNLELAIKVLKGKEQVLTKAGFELDKASAQDRMRMIVSAYNGGEKYVMLARTNLLDFNQKHGTSLDPNNWEDLRLFYLRRELSDKQQRQYFSNKTRERAKKFSISNLAYVENVLGREPRYSL